MFDATSESLIRGYFLHPGKGEKFEK